MFYVYALVDTRDNTVFYIGKGKGTRAKQHFYRFNDRVKNFKQNKIKAIRAAGLEPQLVYLAQELTESAAFDLEVTLIAFFGRLDKGTGCLANLTDGGDGSSGHIKHNRAPHSAETRRKMSESHKGIPAGGHPRSAETREKIAASMRGKPGRATGYRWTEEQKDRQSELLMGRACPTKGKKRIYREDGTFYFDFPGSQKL